MQHSVGTFGEIDLLEHSRALLKEGPKRSFALTYGSNHAEWE